MPEHYEITEKNAELLNLVENLDILKETTNSNDDIQDASSEESIPSLHLDESSVINNANLQLLLEFEIINSEELNYKHGITLLAGFTAFKFKRKYPNLGKYTNQSSYKDVNVDWLHFLSDGYLTVPCAELLDLTLVVDKQFMLVHKKYYCAKSGIIDVVVSNVKSVFSTSIDDEVIESLVTTRTNIRIRELNRALNSKVDETKKKKN